LASERDSFSAHAEMLGNRVAKNVRHLRKWARREGVSCYRVYDRDIPEIPVVIDWYEGRLYVAEYLRSTAEPRPEQWLDGMAAGVARALDVATDKVFTKRRQRQRGRPQYERLAATGARFEVSEGGHSFYVNLVDYLDTGLFLDHRRTRARIEREARGKRFLNLFCYTGSFTVYAAAGGAVESVNVDMSQRYLDWAADNLELNQLDSANHHFVCDDVLEFIADPERMPERFDLAVLDPPTFSNSKRMSGVLDLQRDHVGLINQTMRLLSGDGVLYFSTNSRRFKLDGEGIAAASVEEVTATTIPKDFRNQRIHRCFRFTRA
jgi:23S rRNA G2069 N7-methylase RlmK/C1962 C5-methylase RlmI